jgi:phosphoribosylanthranilate isomerase
MSKLKICGNYLEQDITILNRMGEQVEYIGFIFTPRSKRVVDIDTVANWIARYPDLRNKAVGVFLDQSIEEIAQVVQRTGIRQVQLHGDEAPLFCQNVRERCQVSVWKVISVEEGHISELEPYSGKINALLLDTKVKGQSGGTGIPFDWTLIPKVREFTDKNEIPLWVAGGITPTNIEELLSAYQVDGVDVASGVEAEQGKDEGLVKSLVEGVQRYANQGDK